MALWTQSCVNRGSLGSPSLLTSSLTLINEEDTLTIQALWDPGSESSFFSSDLLPFACHKRDVSFKLETLSASAVKAETVHGLEAAFQVQVPGGECVTLRMLQHSGLELRAHKLKSKILTCSKEFASKYNLDEAEPCAYGQSCLKKPPAKLSLILGQDLHHVAPRLVEQFIDKHGCMSVYACSLSQKLITAGNRMFPYTEETARSALVDTYGFSGTTDDFPELVEDNLSSLPTTALLHGATQDNFPTAVRIDVTHPTLQFPEDLTSTPSPSGASTSSSPRTTTETTTTSTLAAAGASTPHRPVSDQDVSHDGEAGNYDDDREDFEKLHLEIKKEEIKRLLTSGSVSKNLEARLNIFSAAKVVPEHVWKPSCHQCSKCNLCMETGGQTYVERCQTQSFKAHLWRIPHQDGTYHYEVDYLVDPLAEALPCNYMASYQRHRQLRKSFLGLEVESQAEFSSRLTKGLKSKYWKILSKEEALHLRNTDGLYLPAGFVLKKSGTTKARLILDPSGSLNGSLLKAPNLEEKIASVLRRIQAMPILFSADVREAFFKIKVAAASQHKSLFLMDYEPVEKVLQPKETENSELVTVQATSLIMGVNQSPAYLSLAFGDLAEDILDQFLQWCLKYLRYLDDLQSGILAEELHTFQEQIDFQDPELNSPCQDSDCCSCEADLSIPQVEMLGAPVPLDEQRCTRHLYRYKQFGKDVFHCLVLRAAVLEAALVKADLPTKDAITSLQQHFQHEFVNAARALYTQVLLKGGSPEFNLLADLPPPAHLRVWEPDRNGRPRRWNRPWTRRECPEGPPAPPLHLQEEEPILKIAATADHPTDPSKLTCDGATLLGYNWDLNHDSLTTGKNLKINLLPPRRGIRPAWADLGEAEDLLPLHHKRPLTQRQALAMAHLHYDPLQCQPFLATVLKFMYRHLTISSSLTEEMEGGASNFDKVLSDDFVRNHLQPAVSLAIATKRRLGQRRTFQLPACIDPKGVRLTVETLVDGCWGALSGSATMVFLVQRYLFMGNPRVFIYLYSSSTSMNSLSKLGHQVDAELAALALGQKETKKALDCLKEMNVKVERTILVSDSQTCLSLCSKPSATLDLSTSLVVSRIQDLWYPHMDNLFYIPGEAFSQSVDLLTRYQSNWANIDWGEFYSPTWMKKEIPDRVTVNLVNMRQQKDASLPHLCAQQQIWALLKDSNLGPNRFSKQPAASQPLKGSLHSTGSWGLQRKEKCLPPTQGGASCLMCETAPLHETSSQDRKLLKAAKEKHAKKTNLKKKSEIRPKSPMKVGGQKEVSVLSSAALSSFKVSKQRRQALSARSGLADRRPPPEDENLWRTVIASRRGYTYTVRVLARIIGLLRKGTKRLPAGSVSHSGPANLSAHQKALWTIFAEERANSFRAIETRRGTPSFQVEEVNNILFLCGRKMASDPNSTQASIHKQDSHFLMKDMQESRYMVPILSPSSALGVAVAQEIHDQTCGSSPAYAMARATRYFHFSPPAGTLFKALQEGCFKCRRIRMVRGRDLVNPLRHLSDHSMTPGLSIQFDVAGPWVVKTKSKQATLDTRQTRRPTTKMWILLAVDYFTSKLEVSPLEDMTTGSLSAAIQDIITANGWATKNLSIDPGSSLVTAVRDTSEAVAELRDEEDDREEPTEAIPQARELLNGLRNEGFVVKQPFSKASFHQAKIESVIKSFKICLKAAQLPGVSPLTIVTFIIVIRRCAALLNSRPIAILPPSMADPDEIMSVSPSSLTGPSSSTWWSLGRARHYTGQQALIQAHLARFKSQWKTYYTNKLYSNSNMATRSDLEINDVVLITDLSNNTTRSIHPALGRISGFLDPDTRSQAIVKYSTGQVDRPISKLVRIVKSNEQIPAKGKCFCPLAEAEEQVQQHLADREEGRPEDDDVEEAASLTDGGQWDDPVLPPRAEGPLPQPVEQPPPGQVAEEEKEEEVATPPPVPAQAPQRGEVGAPSPQAGAPTSGYPARVRKKVSKF